MLVDENVMTNPEHDSGGRFICLVQPFHIEAPLAYTEVAPTLRAERVELKIIEKANDKAINLGNINPSGNGMGGIVIFEGGVHTGLSLATRKTRNTSASPCEEETPKTQLAENEDKI